MGPQNTQLLHSFIHKQLKMLKNAAKTTFSENSDVVNGVESSMGEDGVTYQNFGWGNRQSYIGGIPL